MREGGRKGGGGGLTRQRCHCHGGVLLNSARSGRRPSRSCRGHFEPSPPPPFLRGPVCHRAECHSLRARGGTGGRGGIVCEDTPTEGHGWRAGSVFRATNRNHLPSAPPADANSCDSVVIGPSSRSACMSIVPGALLTPCPPWADHPPWADPLSPLGDPCFYPGGAANLQFFKSCPNPLLVLASGSSVSCGVVGPPQQGLGRPLKRRSCRCIIGWFRSEATGTKTTLNNSTFGEIKITGRLSLSELASVTISEACVPLSAGGRPGRQTSV